IIALKWQRSHANNHSRDRSSRSAGNQHACKKHANAEKICAAERAEKTSTVFGGKIRRDICADRHETSMPQRKLPSITVDDIETDRQDDVDSNEDNDLQIIRVDRT